MDAVTRNRECVQSIVCMASPCHAANILGNCFNGVSCITPLADTFRCTECESWKQKNSLRLYSTGNSAELWYLLLHMRSPLLLSLSSFPFSITPPLLPSPPLSPPPQPPGPPPPFSFFFPIFLLLVFLLPPPAPLTYRAQSWGNVYLVSQKWTLMARV